MLQVREEARDEMERDIGRGRDDFRELSAFIGPLLLLLLLL